MLGRTRGGGEVFLVFSSTFNAKTMVLGFSLGTGFWDSSFLESSSGMTMSSFKRSFQPFFAIRLPLALKNASFSSNLAVKTAFAAAKTASSNWLAKARVLMMP
jgi:hypothetical protein